MKAVKTWVLIFLLIISAINVHAWPIPDTTGLWPQCYNAVGAVIACPSSGQSLYGQDGNYTIDPPSYTKLDANGAVLADNATTWAMVKDNVTGLIWENKTNDGSIHDRSKTFTWCDTNAATNGGNQGTCGTGTGNTATDTKAYIKALNDANFGGFSDWRMPNVKEMESIVDMGMINPSINTVWFPSTVSSYYWLSTTYAFGSASAWCVYFTNGYAYSTNKTNAYAVRAVRGGQSVSLDHLVINGDETVTDTDTGLMWQQRPPTAMMTWEAALGYAEGLTLAGYDDWRLPTPKELQSIVDYSHYSPYSPAIDTTLFPGTVSSEYWSSTTDASTNGSAWCVSFSNGYVYNFSSKANAYAVRAVRGGQSQSWRVLGHLVISEPRRAARWNSGEPKTIIWDTAGIGGNVKISLSPQGGKAGTFTETIADGVPNNGSYAWTVTGPSSVNYVLKIEPLSDPTKGTTQGLFTIIQYTLNINNGALGTASTTVTLHFTSVGSGAVQMCFRNENETNYGQWEAIASTKTWTLSDGTGVKTVYVKFRDAVGNESPPYSATIYVETTQPVPVITFPSNGTAVISVLEITGTVLDPSPSSGLSKIEIAVSQNTQNGTYYLQSDKTTWSKTSPVYHLASILGNDWSFSLGNVWTPGQSYTVTAIATDNAGNTGSATSTFTFIVQLPNEYTTLTMDLSSQTILNKGQLVVTGKLSRLPEINMDLRNLSIALDITSPPPSGSKIPVNPVLTSVDGSYSFTIPDDNTIFTEKGAYTLQTKFAKTGSLAASASDTKAVQVGASAGYAILVQGKLPGPNPEGLASHNKTTNRIYKTLRNRGFDDANIMYFNYTKPQVGIEIDALPSKECVQSAIEGLVECGVDGIKGWASEKMNAVPAPLYIIMVNHGVPNAFHIGDTTISPAELSAWLDTLETTLDPEAKQEKIITIIGACYSGSFIPVLSKPNTNRIIIASAAADEESYKGPLEGGDSVRSGEYFIDGLFVQLGRGYSLKNSFEEATRETEEYTRKGGASANSPNPYFDTAMQHPLIDDNRDKRGSNVLAQGQGDGQAAKDVYLGTGDEYNNTNAGMVEITAVTETNYLSVAASTASLWLKVNNPTKVSSAWAIIRPPGLDLSQNQTASSYQRDINLTPQLMQKNEGTGRYELAHNGFTEPGMYEIFYYIIETGTPAVVSSLKRSVVYKDLTGNTAPKAATLMKPALNEVTRTALIFQWNASVDSDPVTYNLVIATDSSFTNVVYRKDGIKTTLTSVDASAGLKDLTTYYWRVEAVDGFTRTSSLPWTFKTDNTNGLPGILTGIVFSDRDFSLITAATIEVTVNSISIPPDQVGGYFVLSSLSGTATFEVSAPGYQPLTVSDVAVVAGETTPVNIRMAPESNLITHTITATVGDNGMNGMISCTPNPVNNESSSTCKITPSPNYYVANVLVDGISAGSLATYTFTSVTAAHTISATFAINTYTLAITKVGTGSGIVTSAPGGINCGNVCSASYAAGTPVTLTATPASGSTLTSWSGGGCTGIGNCSMIIIDNTQITALFANPWGDVNNDGKIDLSDAILSLQILSGMDKAGKTITIGADVNNDRKIGMAEAIYILQKVAGMR